MRTIDGDVLFERACNLEAQALEYVGKIVNDESKIEEWKIWSAILAERTAFKHDVFDAPTIEPERKKGKWIDCDGSEHWKCDKCGCRAGYWFNEENSSSWELDMSEWLSNFCPNCGADMTEDKE